MMQRTIRRPLMFRPVVLFADEHAATARLHVWSAWQKLQLCRCPFALSELD